jgi:hypothetical protein
VSTSRKARRVPVPSLVAENPSVRRRFLFVVPPSAGNVEPTVAVGAELVRRGHRVAWVGPGGGVAALLEPGACLYPAEDGEVVCRLPAAGQEWSRSRGPAALRSLWEEFVIPLGHAMLPGVEAAIEDFCPDAIVTDQQALAGAVAARGRHLPWATLATTSTEFIRALSEMPEVENWVTERIAEFQRAHRLAPMDLRFRDHMGIVLPDEIDREAAHVQPSSSFVAAGCAGQAAERLEKLG